VSKERKSLEKGRKKKTKRGGGQKNGIASGHAPSRRKNGSHEKMLQWKRGGENSSLYKKVTGGGRRGKHTRKGGEKEEKGSASYSLERQGEKKGGFIGGQNMRGTILLARFGNVNGENRGKEKMLLRDVCSKRRKREVTNCGA